MGVYKKKNNMTLSDFFGKYEGRGIDYDGAYSFQCVDLYRQFVKEILNAKQSPPVKGAKDIWTTYSTDVFTKISNNPDNAPKAGDVVIWGEGIGPYGHIAICSEQGDKYSFTSFDQNYPLGSVCHFQKHTYFSVLGWLRPKSLLQPAESPTTAVNPDQIKIDLGEPFGVQEVQAVVSMLRDNKKALDDLIIEMGGLTTQIQEMVKFRQSLAERLGCADDQAVIVAEIKKLIDKEDQQNETASGLGSLIERLINLFKKRGDK